MSYFIFNAFSYLQQFTLYDRRIKKTIVIIMRDFKIIPYKEKYKANVKEMERKIKTCNICLTNNGTDGTIV